MWTVLNMYNYKFCPQLLTYVELYNYACSLELLLPL